MTAAATAAVALVLIAGGVLTVATFADRERSSLDRELEQPCAGAGRPGGAAGADEAWEVRRGAWVGGPWMAAASRDRPTSWRRAAPSCAWSATARCCERRATCPTRACRQRSDPGFATVDAGGGKWRILTIPLKLPPGFGGPSEPVIQFGADAGPLESRIDSMQRRVALISVLGIGLTVILASVLAGPALAPLSRLRRSVAGVTTTRDLSRRLPEGDAGREVDELAHGVNEMLARLESSSSETERALEATRRFAGDVGHEVRTPLTSMRANIDAVRRNPSMPEAERRAVLDDVAREQEDLVAVLDALQALARGDSAAALPREPVDMAEVIDAAVEAARRRHPEAHVELSAAEGEHLITGWPDGLRLLIDNLIENAIRHGGARVDRRPRTRRRVAPADGRRRRPGRPGGRARAHLRALHAGRAGRQLTGIGAGPGPGGAAGPAAGRRRDGRRLARRRRAVHRPAAGPALA